MRTIDKIIIHCSDSLWGSAEEIDKWHKARGFNKIGYHYVVLNGFITYEDLKNKNKDNTKDGLIEVGRNESEIGAHVLDMNANSIGICLIGIKDFTPLQMSYTYKKVVELVKKYNLTENDVLGHYECPTGKAQGKTCPNIKMDDFRKEIAWRMWF